MFAEPDLIGCLGTVRRPHPFVLGLEHPSLPSFVSVASLCPRIPSPPLLRAEDSESTHVNLLAMWYEGAVWAAYGKRSWIFRYGGMRSRWKPLLVAASKVCMEHDIRPAAWCRFSMSVYQTRVNVESKKPPTPPYVFSVKRIEKQRGWFKSEITGYAGNRVVYTPTARVLMKKQAQLKSKIAQVYPRNDNDLKRVVESVLSVDEHSKLVDTIKQEAYELTRDLRSQAESGRWIW